MQHIQSLTCCRHQYRILRTTIFYYICFYILCSSTILIHSQGRAFQNMEILKCYTEMLVYFKNNITVKLLKLENLPSDIEAIFIEMNVKSKNG